MVANNPRTSLNWDELFEQMELNGIALIACRASHGERGIVSDRDCIECREILASRQRYFVLQAEMSAAQYSGKENRKG